MNIICEPRGDYAIAHLSGSLDMSAGPQLREAACIESRDRHLILDLSQVDFMDSAGLAALVIVIRAHKSAGRRCVMAAPTPVVARILKVTAIHQLAAVEQSLQEAVQLLTET